MSKVLIFIPTLNEVGNLDELFRRISSVNAGADILVVDDGSTDGTGNKVLELEKNNPRIRHLFRSVRGRGTAQKSMYLYALKHNYDIIIEMDADLSHNPFDIPRFLDAIKTADVVIGSRLDQKSNQKGRGLHRQWLTHLANFYVKTVMAGAVTDYTSGYRCLRVDCLRKFPVDKLMSTTPALLEEILYVFIKLGCRIREIPITFHERNSGKTKLTFADLIRIFLSIRTIKRYWDQILVNQK